MKCGTTTAVVVAIALVLAGIAFAVWSSYGAKEHFSGWVVQFVYDERTTPSSYPQYTALKAAAPEYQYSDLSSGSPRGRTACTQYGIGAYPDLRVTVDGASVSRYRGAWVAADMEAWLRDTIPAGSERAPC